MTSSQPGSSCILAVDLGGTSIKACVTRDLIRYSPVATVATHTSQPPLAPERLFQFCFQVLAENRIARNELSAVGISLAGVVDTDRQTVRRALNIGWKNLPLGTLAASVFQVPVVVDTDIFCAALAETRMGMGREKEHFMVVTIGTGIGHALVTSGTIVRGAHQAANVLGHVPVEPGGAPCYCGNSGCLCQYASGEGIARLAREALPSRSSQLGAPEVMQAAARGESWAQTILDRATRYLATGLGAAVGLTDAGCLVLSGGTVTEFWPDLNRLQTAIAGFSHPEVNPVSLHKTTVRPHPNLVGAASLHSSYPGGTND